MKRFLKKKYLLIGGVVLVVAIAMAVKLSNGNGKQYATVVRADVVQQVAVTGKVKPQKSVELGFDQGGRVGSVYASVGQTVEAGEVLASLESGQASADLAKAQANLEAEKIKLRELQATAPVSYDDAMKNLEASIRSGFAAADGAVRNRADQFFKSAPDNPRFEVSITSGNFVHYFNVPDGLALELNTGRKQAEEILNSWQSRLGDLRSGGLAAAADQSIADLGVISDFLDLMAEAVNSFTSADYSYDTTISGYKTAVAAARGEVSSAVSGLVTAKDKFTAAGTLQGGRFQSVLKQESSVAAAQAAVDSLAASLGKSTIRAPFDGVVTLQEAKVGAAVSGGSKLISLVSLDDMYIEANVSEIHIGKIAAGNPVSVTFDAFPGEVFPGNVSYIEPGDVLIDGIVNYKVRVSLEELDPRVKSGLTANLKIETAKKTDVATLPLYAVIKEGDQAFVNKIVNGKPQKTPVSLGLSGSDGTVEISSGLEAGDRVEF